MYYICGKCVVSAYLVNCSIVQNLGRGKRDTVGLVRQWWRKVSDTMPKSARHWKQLLACSSATHCGCTRAWAGLKLQIGPPIVDTPPGAAAGPDALPAQATRTSS